MSAQGEKVRQRKIEMFEACVARALAILGREDSDQGSLTDACRLIDAALKTAPAEPSSSEKTEREAAANKLFGEQIAGVYGSEALPPDENR